MQIERTLNIGGKRVYAPPIMGGKSRIILKPKNCVVCAGPVFSNYPACEKCFKAGRYKKRMWKRSFLTRQQQEENKRIVDKIRDLKERNGGKETAYIKRLRSKIK